MQIVSGRFDRPRIHFEAPPSTRVKSEMANLITWFDRTGPKGSEPLPNPTRAGIAHLNFESIHPFEDSNGRIGRALSVKVLAQSLGQPSLVALGKRSSAIARRTNQWLERGNEECELNRGLVYFAEPILQAQRTTMKHVEFYIAKTKSHDRLRGKLKPRQAKVIARMFEEGVDGWKAARVQRTTSASPRRLAQRRLVICPDQRCPDITRAGALLGWEPKIEFESHAPHCVTGSLAGHRRSAPRETFSPRS